MIDCNIYIAWCIIVYYGIQFTTVALLTPLWPSTERFGLTRWSPCGHRGDWPMPPRSSESARRRWWCFNMFQQVGVLPKSVWMPKMNQESSEMQNWLGYVGMISLSYYHGSSMLPKAFSCCVGMCRWVRTQQWILLREGSLPKEDIGSGPGWWFIMIDSYPARHIQLFCQLFMLVRKNDFLLIQVEAKSQENHILPMIILYRQQLHL